jgi:hypothetical protein
MNTPFRLHALALGALLLAAGSAQAATLAVGPSSAHKTPCSAFAAAANGDTVTIDAKGSYSGDVCFVNPNNLIIRGVNGRPKIDAAGRAAGGKGIWAIAGNNVTVENIEFTGAKVNDRNGAGIRLDGVGLTVRGSYFHDNENGILTSNNGGAIVIENSEFGRNGYGDGYSHNVYVGRVDSLIFVGNYSHDANVGHNLKTRAQTNVIKYNRFSSAKAGAPGAGSPSYEIDIPNAGSSWVVGNVIQQPAGPNNPGILTYGTEGATNRGSDLYVVNNTFLNDNGSGGTFLFVGSGVATPVLAQNNVFAGVGRVSSQDSTVLKTNYFNAAPAFVDRANFDLRPASGSPMVNGGSEVTPSSANPTLQYKHAAQTGPRAVDGKIDIGAYENAGAQAGVPDAWTLCATENGTCSVQGTRQVRFGANGSFVTKTITGSIACTNVAFGSDPAQGVVKSCSYGAATEPATPTPTPTPATWTVCAAENGSCSFTGKREVRYGAAAKFTSKVLTGPVACTNAVFGDPIVGVVKSCSYSSLAQ